MKFLLRFIIFIAFLLSLVFPVSFYFSFYLYPGEIVVDTFHFILQLAWPVMLLLIILSEWFREKFFYIVLLPRDTANSLMLYLQRRKTARLAKKKYVRLKNRLG